MKKLFWLLWLSFLVPTAWAQNYTLDFNGATDYVTINSNYGLSTSNVTVECWVFIPSTSEQGTFVNIGGPGEGYAIGVGNTLFDDSGNQLIYINDMIAWHTTGSNLGTGWHHVAFTIDPNGLTNVYLDGKSVLSFTETPLTPLNATYIGASNAGSRILSNGKIDEVRIWSTARSEAEIKGNMFHELQGNETNLVAYYKMNDGSGSTLSDQTSNSNDGTITGATWQHSGAFSGPRQQLDFDGINDFVEIDAGLSFSSAAAVTIEGWIYPRSFNPASPDANISNLLGYHDGSCLVRIGDAGIANNQLQFILFQTDRLDANTLLNSNTWYHVAAVYDGTSSYLYINGELDNSMTTSLSSFTSAYNFILGASPPDIPHRMFDGNMDEVRVWSDARTATEIRDNMMRSLNGDEAGLLAYYRFDHTDGTTLYDYSASGYNGYLTDMDGATDWIAGSAFNTWIGGESGSWSTTANWSLNSVPGSGGNVGIFSSAAGNDAIVSGNPALGSLVIASGATMTLTSGMSVADKLIVENDLDLNGNTIELDQSALLIEDGGNLFGTSGTITTTRNYTGAADESVGGLGIHLTMNGGTGNTTITRGHAVQTGGGHQSILRYFEIIPQWTEFSSADIIFHYSDSELNGLTESALHLFQSEDGGASWTDRAGTVNTTDNTITVTGITSFSRWTAGNGSDLSLPVELTSFTAQAGDRQVTLRWVTESEIENDAFVLERSLDGELFAVIAEIPGQGSSSEQQAYSFTDKNVFNGITYYYRLSDRDYNGVITMHKTISVVPNSAGIESRGDGTTPIREFALAPAYPNPFNPETTLRFAVPNSDNASQLVRLAVYNILGQQVAVLYDGPLPGGEFAIKWNGLNDLGVVQPSGNYFVILSTATVQKTQKIVLIR
jgi:hypothetical protein